ncbi:hypothetical protein D9M69_442060 [compost metagenome]
MGKEQGERSTDCGQDDRQSLPGGSKSNDANQCQSNRFGQRVECVKHVRQQFYERKSRRQCLTECKLQLSNGGFESRHLMLRSVLHDVVGALRGSGGLVHSLHLLVESGNLVGQRQDRGTPLDIRNDLTHCFDAKLLAGDLLQRPL